MLAATGGDWASELASGDKVDEGVMGKAGEWGEVASSTSPEAPVLILALFTGYKVKEQLF